MSQDKKVENQSKQEQENLIEIPEEKQEVSVEITEDNVSQQEYDLAKKHGLVKPKQEKKDEQPVEPKPETEDNKGK